MEKEMDEFTLEVKKIEEQAEKILQDADSKKEEIIANAKTESIEQIAKKQEDLEKKKDEKIQKEKQTINQSKDEILKKGQKDLNEFEKKSKKKVSKAVDFVMKKLNEKIGEF